MSDVIRQFENPPPFEVVTCIGPGGWELYGKRMVETYVKFWPWRIPLTCYYHDCDRPSGDYPGVEFVDLLEANPDCVAFKERAKLANGLSPEGKYNYRFDALKFCHKVFAIAHKLAHLNPEVPLIWLDADTFSHAEVTESWLSSIMPKEAELVCLRRQAINYSETSFLAMRGKGKLLFTDLVDMYVDGEIFNFTEHHDGFIFERLLYLHCLHGLKAYSLTPPDYKGLEAFEASPLAAKLHHLKGNLKNSAPQGPIATHSRYQQLCELVRHYSTDQKSFNILETGTWNGQRAVDMANAAFANVDEVTYWGYDLFEDATPESDAEEFNSKKHNTRETVAAALEEYKKSAAANGKTFSYVLTKGDTKRTLKAAPLCIDFAFLDGGHSAETAAHDFKCCDRVPVVVLDDFIIPDASGGDQPDAHKGTNFVIKNLKNRKTYTLPSKDPVVGGGITQLALVLPLGSKAPPEFTLAKGDPGWRPMVVHPHDSVDESHLFKNVDENLAIIPEWAESCKPHKGKMVVCSAGPSLEKNINKIKDLQAKGALVVAIKHALPILKKHKIKPWAIVVLDPRPIEGVSTHGIVRQDLFAAVPDGTICFVASMTDPGVTKYLQGRGLRIVGWHAYTQGLVQYKKWPPNTPLITGGTCSAWRCLGLGDHLGFGDFEFFGMDFNFPEGTVDMSAKDDKGRQKYFTVSPDQGKTKYISTGELVAAAQDIKHIIPMCQTRGLAVLMHGDGFGQHLWKLAFQGGKPMAKFSFDEVYGGQKAVPKLRRNKTDKRVLRSKKQAPVLEM